MQIKAFYYKLYVLVCINLFEVRLRDSWREQQERQQLTHLTINYYSQKARQLCMMLPPKPEPGKEGQHFPYVFRTNGRSELWVKILEFSSQLISDK